MIVITQSELALAQVNLDSFLTHYVERNKALDQYQLIYVGGPWCAPCKALKPVLMNQLSSMSNVVGYELNLDEAFDYSNSRLILSLPSLFLCYQGRIINSAAGLLDSKALNALFAPLTINEEPLEFNEKQAEAIDTMVTLLHSCSIEEAQNYYKSLIPEVRFSAHVQQTKSLLDLVSNSIDKLAINECTDDRLLAVYKQFSILNIEQGLKLIAESSLLVDEEGRKIYVQAINTLTDRQLANKYRRLL